MKSVNCGAPETSPVRTWLVHVMRCVVHDRKSAKLPGVSFSWIFTMRRASIAIRIFFALCLLGATFNHLRTIVQHGLLWDYGYGATISPLSKVYWDTLAVLDPLAALLLFLKPRAGVWLTVLIIVSDVLHNTYYVAVHNQWSASFYLAQVGFLVVVLCLAPVAARGVSPRSRVTAFKNSTGLRSRVH